MSTERAGRETGQTTPLIIGFVLVLVLAVQLVATASSVFLTRRSLFAWADGAAVVAAQSVAERSVYGGHLTGAVPLAEDDARAAIDRYLKRHGVPGRFDDLAVVSVDVDPVTSVVTVELATSVNLLWGGDSTGGLDGDLAVTATASAVAATAGG